MTKSRLCPEKGTTINMNKLIKLYTPFICSISSTIHGVLYINKVDTVFYWLASNLTGHSLLVLAFILIHSKRMCKWYKLSIYCLMFVHVVNILTRFELISRPDSIKMSILINLAALLFWLIFRVTYKTTNIILRECKYEEERRRY